MKLFRRQVCDNIVYFENRACGRCGHRLAYAAELETMSALEPAADESWTPFVAMNSVNQAMGRPDLYPFIIAPAVVEKLRFIHGLVRAAARTAPTQMRRTGPLEPALPR